MAKKPGASSFFLIAFILGVAAAFLVWRHEKQVASQRKENWKTVVTARLDIPARTQIGREMVEPTPVPDELRVVNPYNHIEETVGKWTTREIRAKEQIRTTDAVPKEQLPSIAEKIPKGMRLITIGAGELQTVAGAINPGDSVDILATYFDTQKKRETTQMILQNIKVFFVNQAASKSESESPGSSGAKSSLTLVVTPEVAELIAAAERKATLKLALRNTSDASELIRPVPDVSQIWALLETAQKVESPGSTNAPAITYPVTKSNITIIRGTAETQVPR